MSGRHRAFLALPLTLAACGLLWQTRAYSHPTPAPQAPPAARREGAPPAAPASPVAQGSTPGQLSILDKKGKPAGICPLEHTDVNADIAGYVSRVTVTQQFANPTPSPVEAVYTFPLPEDAAVDDMTLHIGPRTIHSQILPREQAREVYEAAKTDGKTTALLDQERSNIFTQSVANILPGEKVTITIRYVNLLKYQEGHYEFVFPMVVGPRYIPGAGSAPAPADPAPAAPGPQVPEETIPTVVDADKITPPVTPPGTRAGHDISLTVHLDAGLPLQEVRSALHPVTIRQVSPTRAIVQLQNQQEIPNKDFILRYTAAGSELQSGLLTFAATPSKTAGPTTDLDRPVDGYFTLILQPPMAPPRTQITPKEMVFVIDQTGSQAGWPIQKAKETMRYCIRNLNPGDTFQLLGFNTQLYPCFPHPVPATEATIATALKFLDPIEGNGGTDILKSVDYALSLPDDPDRLRIVCYMTDGYVGNDYQIIHCVQQHRGRARMFPFGVGNAVNRFLIEGMAREGQGASEYVALNDPGEVAAARFYHRVADPLLLDVQVDWNGLPVTDVYPRHIADVFSAAPIIVKGRYSRAGEGDITVRGLLRGRPWHQTLHVVFPGVQPENSALQTLWAREKLEDLESQDWLGLQKNEPLPHIKDQIVQTALDYHLMSPYTSLVAVEEQVVNVGGQTRRLDVPVEMPEGVSYEGVFGTATASAGTSSLALGGRAAFGAGGFRGGRGFQGYGQTPSLMEELPSGAETATADGDAILDGTEAAQKQLQALKPEQRQELLEQVKLAAGLRGLEAKVKKEGVDGSLHKPGLPRVDKGRVEVQIWLNRLPSDGLQKLKDLGFTLEATPKPGKLLLGTLPVSKLEALLELAFVRRVEPPRFQ